MPLRDTDGFSEKPDIKWPRRDILVFERDITRIFKGFQDGEIGFCGGPTCFNPRSCEGVKVYVNFSDITSLFIVAESEEIANKYICECLGIKERPYNVSKRRDFSSYPW